MTFICRNTTLDCSQKCVCILSMQSIYVFDLCSPSMYPSMYVHLCSPSMQSIYAVYLCILSMYSIYVFYVVLSMQPISMPSIVCILSMKTRLQNQNFTIFKIALNRVLTLPDYRARCTDHFAGSGSKIENKTYPWWQNTENIEFRSQCHILRCAEFSQRLPQAAKHQSPSKGGRIKMIKTYTQKSKIVTSLD